MKRKRLLCDVDEVLADFHTPTFEILGKLTGKTHTAHDFTDWDVFPFFPKETIASLIEEIKKPGWCRSLKPYPGAVEAMRELQKMVDVYPVTSPFDSVPWVSERNAWLKEHFGFDRTHIVHTPAKFLVAGDALLDDKPETIVSWAEHPPNGVPMLWHTPNTRTAALEQYRVHTWDEVLARVEAIVKAA